VQNLSIVPDTDLKAIATYVATVAGTPNNERIERGDKAIARAKGDAAGRTAGPPAGAAIYAGACAQCHGEAGRAPLSPALNLTLASSVRGRDANNLIRVILEGLQPSGNGHGSMMPGFAAVLSDKQLADLVDYIRASFSDGPAFAGVDKLVRTAR
jgi:mono/diheme cytochrome c family protein